MEKLILVMAFMLSSLNANATDFSYCAKQSNDRERLACFDQIVEKLGISINKKKEKEESNDEQSVGDLPKWVVREDVSLIDDSKTVVLALPAENNIQGSYSDVLTPTIYLRCENNKTVAYINIGLFLGSDSFRATSRLDKNKAQKKTWSISTDHMAMFARKPISFIKSLIKHKKFLVEFVPYSDNRRSVKFDIRGLEESIKPLRKTCNW